MKKLIFLSLLSCISLFLFDIKGATPFIEEDSVILSDTTANARSVEEILESITIPEDFPVKVNMFSAPRVFLGYQDFPDPHNFNSFSENLTSIPAPEGFSFAGQESLYSSPYWLKANRDAIDMQEAVIYQTMVENPHSILTSFWALPVPPSLPDDDLSFGAFIRRNHLTVNVNAAVIPEVEIEKRYWIHQVNAALQFSQAYLSKNWYQGGNNYLSLLGQFFWDVQLNQIWNPNIIFQSTLSYKLGLNSSEENKLHKYSISEDLFQYNLKFGYKAAHHWYYSFTAQFKTQFLNNYPKDSEMRTASFLTPGSLTLGLGMTYTKQNEAKTISFNASISPLSYNLKTAIDSHVDHLQFGMSQSARTDHEFGSSADITFLCQIGSNVSYSTRLFLFTDYHNSQADWQNTLEFKFNRFFSTQLYANLRYDSSADLSLAPGWKRWMIKEILSVGLSYTFNSKQ